LYIVSMIILLGWISLAAPAAGETTEGHLPSWKEGFGWSYEVDHDVDYDIGGFIQVNHIKENWTRTVYKVLDVGGQAVYQVWEQRRGVLDGTVTYGLTFPVKADAFGSGWTFIRASDMAVINQTFNLTFTGDLPMGMGKFTGGFDNYTTFDPPMPMLEFPIPSTKWDVRSRINITTEFFVLAPIQDKTWYNTSELWDLDVTATGPAPMTVPAGTYDTFTIHETGTRTNATATWPVDRKWYYADEALNYVRTFESHVLVWTDAVYTPPNSPPEGPDGTIDLATDEDVPLDIVLTPYFSDPDDDALTYGLVLVGASGGNATLTGSGAIRTLTPMANWSGVLDLLATVTDPFGHKATGDVRVTVASVNDPPRVIWEPHNLATEEDNPLFAAHDVGVVFADVDGDPLTLAANSTPGVTAFMNGTAVDLIPDQDWTGLATIVLSARDPAGEEVNTSFELLVGEVNDPPVIVSSGGPTIVHEVDSGEFWVQVEDTDSVDLEFKWSVNGALVGGVDGPSFTFAPGFQEVSSVTVTITVEDEWNAQDTMSWVVVLLHSPIIISSGPPSPVSAMVGDTVTFTIDVEDADTNDPNIVWTWNGDVMGSGEELPMRFGDRDEGTGTLRVEVDDGMGNDFVQWSVTVTVPNEPPTVYIESPPDGVEMTLGESLMLRAVVDDEDVDGLTVRWSVDGSPVGNGLEVNFTPSMEGQMVVSVTVSDAEYDVSASSTITVNRKEPTDTPEEPSSSGLWIAMVMIALILLTMVVVYIRTRPDRQG
jgi:hypothetical protein